MGFFRSWQFFALLAAFFAAMTNICLKIGVQHVNSNMATWIRVVVLMVVLTPLLFVLRQWQPLGSISARTWIFLTLSGLASGASWMAYHHALQRGEVSLVGPIDKLSVVLVILTGVFVLGEHLNARRWAGVALLVAGIVLLAWPTAEERAKMEAARRLQLERPSADRSADAGTHPPSVDIAGRPAPGEPPVAE